MAPERMARASHLACWHRGFPLVLAGSAPGSGPCGGTPAPARTSWARGAAAAALPLALTKAAMASLRTVPWSSKKLYATSAPSSTRQGPRPRSVPTPSRVESESIRVRSGRNISSQRGGSQPSVGKFAAPAECSRIARASLPLMPACRSSTYSSTRAQSSRQQGSTAAGAALGALGAGQRARSSRSCTRMPHLGSKPVRNGRSTGLAVRTSGLSALAKGRDKTCDGSSSGISRSVLVSVASRGVLVSVASSTLRPAELAVRCRGPLEVTSRTMSSCSIVCSFRDDTCATSCSTTTTKAA
mmetsp:Transcript_76823/g.238514  ORF Transcript_76823/g.238514 Transcript_76823/m.238514 type:complete len:299 (-) Transcript_76823:357-1253(-)